MCAVPANGKEVTITNTELRTLLQQQWPELDQDNVYLPDTKFILISPKELEEIIEDNPLSKYKYIDQAFDCDDYCLLLQAHVIIKRYTKIVFEDRTQFPWAFGQMWFKAKDSYHTLNICITSDNEIRVIEAQLNIFSLLRKDIEVTFIRF